MVGTVLPLRKLRLHLCPGSGADPLIRAGAWGWPFCKGASEDGSSLREPQLTLAGCQHEEAAGGRWEAQAGKPAAAAGPASGREGEEGLQQRGWGSGAQRLCGAGSPGVTVAGRILGPR